ncbi:MAG: anaerobic glycerol-3-phosphate dehydrogenase subunit C [bacterium]
MKSPPNRRTIRQLRSELKSLLSGDVCFDDQTRLQYSTAACMYRVFPTAVVMPRDGDDVRKTVKIAGELGIPVTPRGAGAGLTGGCLGTGIIIDFSRYMHRILSIDTNKQTVVAEPGVVQNDLNRALARHGLFFPPDPSSYMYSTLGGMVGNNAAGPHSVKYGSTRDYIHSVTAICATGEEITFHNNIAKNELLDRYQSTLVEGAYRILKENADVIRDYMPKTRKNSSGYRVDNLIDDDRIHLANLMAASEGTLGVFTGFELAVRPRPQNVGMLLLMFDSVQLACEAVPIITSFNPSMLELMESTFIDLVRQTSFDVGIPFPRNLQALLLIEFDDPTFDEIMDKISAIERFFIGPGRPAIASRRGIQPLERERLDRVRRSASPILNRYPAPYKPIKFIEDTVVPLENLSHYIKRMHGMFKTFDIRGVIYGHAGDGHIHVNPLFNIHDTDIVRKMTKMADFTHDLILEYGGSLSGEHGDGLLRTPFLKSFFRTLYPVFESIKKLFDPEMIFNPGKIIQTDSRRFTDNLKITDMVHVRHTETFPETEIIQENLFKCSSCGACRQYCPVFLATYDERTTPRSKANLLIRIISSSFPTENEAVSPIHRSIFDYCIHCNTCITECPSNVDIPLLMQMAKQVCNDQNGIFLADRLMSEPGLIRSLGRMMPNTVNFVLNTTLLRKVLEKSLSLDTRVKLAPFDDADLSSIAQEISSGAGKPIVYFPGCFAEANDPRGEGASTLAVLSHHGFTPFIPELKCCGISGLSSGMRNAIKSQAEYNVNILHDVARSGIRIVTSAPSCGMTLRHEYTGLLHTHESHEVAADTVDIHEFLVELLSSGKLDTRFEPIEKTIAVHQPCHARAMGIGEYPIRLLEMVQGLKIHRLEPLCCGMAGTYGMKKRNYALSQKIGTRLFREILQIKPDYVVSACGTCRIQIEAATGIDTVHPVSILARAYKLQPIVAGILKQSRRQSLLND